jgi:phosphocarrier protein
MSDPVRRSVRICNERGLHARPAAKIVKLADTFTAETTLSHDGEQVSARSIMGLLMLGAGPGVEIEIAGIGPDAHAAVDAITALIADGFGER